MTVRSILIVLLSVVALSAFRCHKENTTKWYKAKLDVKGICMNYTISVIDGDIDPALVEASWTDPATNKTYPNAFGLKSICTFPPDINEGDEFYFKIEEVTQNCGVCMAYYPTPPKRLSIVASKTLMD